MYDKSKSYFKINLLLSNDFVSNLNKRLLYSSIGSIDLNGGSCIRPWRGKSWDSWIFHLPKSWDSWIFHLPKSGDSLLILDLAHLLDQIRVVLVVTFLRLLLLAFWDWNLMSLNLMFHNYSSNVKLPNNLIIFSKGMFK
jgi:hypothetical protein